VKAFELLGCENERADFKVVCSSGTYVRCLAYDLGVALGWGAHLSALRRTKVGGFLVEDALPVNDLETLTGEEIVVRHLIPSSRAIDFLPSVVLDGDGMRALCNGGSVSGRAVLKWDGFQDGEVLRVLDEKGVLRALGTSFGRETGGRPATVSPVRVLLD
jgi:tRNA U55 pseudouridine synthase TruB